MQLDSYYILLFLVGPIQCDRGFSLRLNGFQSRSKQTVGIEANIVHIVLSYNNCTPNGMAKRLWATFYNH